jgi:hypothetical protein
MFEMKSPPEISPPVAIGGIGGSGTRLIAAMLKELDFFIGSDLNMALDNLWFTMLFKRLATLDCSDDYFFVLSDIFEKGMRCGAVFDENQIRIICGLEFQSYFGDTEQWLRDRVNSLLASRESISKHYRWGWKEPNTHIHLNRLFKYFPEMKYIHVMRNGLDMAFSDNQNQLRLWGGRLLGRDMEVTPYFALKYWRKVHERILNIGSQLGGNFLLLNYDDFCNTPEIGIRNLLDFLEVDTGFGELSKLSRLVNKPLSMGRYLGHDKEQFDPEDIQFVIKMGFQINW